MSTPAHGVRAGAGLAGPEDFCRFREFLGQLPPGALAEARDMHPALPFAAAPGHPPREYPEYPL